MKKNYSIPRAETRCTKAISLKHLSNKAIIHSAILLFCTIGILGTSPALAQQSKIDSLKNLLISLKEDTNKVNVLVKLGQALNTVNPSEGINKVKQGLELSQKLKDNNYMNFCLASLGSLYSQQSKYDSALVYFKKSYDIELKNNSERTLAQLCMNLGTTYSHIGSIENALFFFKDAAGYYTSIGDKNGTARAYLGMGNAIQSNGNFALAIEYYNKSIELYKGANNEKEIGKPYLALSYLYTFIEKLDLAEKFANEAKVIAEISNDKFLKCNTLQAFGSIYIKREKYLESNKFLFDAKKIAEELGLKYQIVLSVKRIGINYANLNESSKAEEYFKEALRIVGSSGDQTSLAEINQHLGYLSLSLHQYNKAIYYLDQSDKISKKIGNKLMLLNNSRDKLEAFCGLNKSDSILIYFDRYRQLADSINTERNSKAIAEMQTKYETEKKDKEILSLNLEAQKRKNTVWLITSGFGFLLVLSGSGFGLYRNRKKKEQAELQYQITEHDIKALRAQMNPHFIFNCIHSIDCLLDDGKIQKSKENLAKFSSLTRSVLENSERREIPLQEELRILSLYLDLENSRFDIPFTYLFEIDPVIDPDETLVPPVILQPFAENAIKHGFDKAKGGHIKITVNCENNQLVCTIEDNGCGRKISQKTVQVSGIKKGSMGLKLTEDRLKLVSQQKQAKAGFAIEDLLGDNNSPAGTRIRLELPME